MTIKERIENNLMVVVFGVVFSSVVVTAGVCSWFWKQETVLSNQKSDLLSEKIAAKDDHIKILKGTITEWDTQINSLKSQIQKLENTIAIKDREI